jgi:hypothetical protein
VGGSEQRVEDCVVAGSELDQEGGRCFGDLGHDRRAVEEEPTIVGTCLQIAKIRSRSPRGKLQRPGVEERLEPAGAGFVRCLDPEDGQVVDDPGSRWRGCSRRNAGSCRSPGPASCIDSK